MMRKTLWLALPLALLAGCATPEAASPRADAVGEPLVAGTVFIYRGVNVLPNSTNIDWSNASFGVSGNPTPTLSFFNAMAGNRPCWLRVTVDAPNVPVVPGQGGDITVTIPPPPPAPPPPGPSPWAAVFDDNPPGHWSITKATITGGANVSNAVAGTWAGRVFQASTAAGQVAILDGTVQGCQM